MKGEVWSYSENPPLARELLMAGEELARSLSAVSLMILTEQAKVGRNSGRILVIKSGLGLGSHPDLIAEALARAARRRRPSVILVGSTRAGRIVAAKLAVKLREGCLSDVQNLGTDGSSVFGDRSVYAGKVVAQVKASLPCVAVVKAGAYPQGSPGEGGSEFEDVGPLTSEVRVIETIEKHAGAVDLRNASIIVSAGRGFRKKEDLQLVEELARTIGGAVGCSRPLSSDYGWLAEEQHIGLTGLSVRPDLYLALGISGQLQHIAGIKESKVIAAVNTDREAPIFQVSDYGIVGDIYKVIPEMLRILKS